MADAAAWLTTVDAVVVAPDAVETAECVAELAVETTDCAVELAVDTADCAVDDAVLVTPEVETGGEGTETEGPEEEPALTDGVETAGSPEARLADAPDPTTAAGANVRTQTRISDFARFIEVVLLTLNARWGQNFSRWGQNFSWWGQKLLPRLLAGEPGARFRLLSCLLPVR